MRQKTFAAGDFERYRKPTRREQFLAEMDKVVPWSEQECQCPVVPCALTNLYLAQRRLQYQT